MQLRPSVPFAALAVPAIALAALLLAGCGGKDAHDGAPPNPPDTAANFAQPIDAKAADSSWSLKIRDNRITLSRYGQADLTVTAPGAMIEPHQATWIAHMPDNQLLTVKVYASACVYPATTQNHVFSAEVDLPDAPPLSGCGDPAAAQSAPATAAAAKPAKK